MAMQENSFILDCEEMTMADDLRKSGIANQVKGSAKEAAGKMRRNVGDLADNPNDQIKGGAKEVEGRVQRKIGETQSRIDRDRNSDR
jgi:uncharacterized protein YjbJ (UPF0337 family)